jgi:UDP-N-acetylmuramate--alanine ligase
MLAVVTNIDADHLETYGGDFGRLRATFLEFLHRLPFYGLAVVCIDDAEIRELLPQIARPVLTYGYSEDADLRVLAHRPAGGGSDITARLPGGEVLELHLNLPGRHNVLNAMAALAVGQELGAPAAAMVKALRGFAGVGRRCESHGRLQVGEARVELVDDYGHHPRELAATFEAMRAAWPGRRLVVAFQPHRYSRTRDCFDDFAAVLSDVDALVLTEVYAAGESPIEGADARALARGIRARGRVEPVRVATVAELFDSLPPLLRDGDVLLTLGAGDIGGLPAQLVARYGPGAAP